MLQHVSMGIQEAISRPASLQSNVSISVPQLACLWGELASRQRPYRSLWESSLASPWDEPLFNMRLWPPTASQHHLLLLHCQPVASQLYYAPSHNLKCSG